MKKVFALLFIVLAVSILSVGLFSMEASAATSGTTGDCTWTLDGWVLTISGNGKMGDYFNSYEKPWDPKKVIIEEGVTSIGNYAFSNCKVLESVIIPNSVTRIGNSAFYNCLCLTDITIPDSVTSIDMYAFSECKNLTDITIPNSVTSIGTSAFYNCTNLINITLPFVGSSRTANETFDAVLGYIFGSMPYSMSGYTQQYYKSGASYYYKIPSSLRTVTITDTTQIPYGAFYNCNKLNITLLNGVKSIGGSAFTGCNKLTNYNLPDSVISIGAWAFYDCKNLTSITIHNSVATIEYYAFNSCNSFTDVWYVGTVSEGQNITIASANNELTNATWHYIDNACDTTCNVCSQVRDVPDHAYDNACDTICNVCEEPREVPEHVYDDDSDLICNECGYERPPYVPGDLDGNDKVDSADAIYLLYHTLFGSDRYPVNQHVDYDGNGKTASVDAIYLLYYTLFGATRYPI